MINIVVIVCNPESFEAGSILIAANSPISMKFRMSSFCLPIAGTLEYPGFALHTTWLHRIIGEASAIWVTFSKDLKRIQIAHFKWQEIPTFICFFAIWFLSPLFICEAGSPDLSTVWKLGRCGREAGRLDHGRTKHVVMPDLPSDRAKLKSVLLDFQSSLHTEYASYYINSSPALRRPEWKLLCAVNRCAGWRQSPSTQKDQKDPKGTTRTKKEKKGQRSGAKTARTATRSRRLLRPHVTTCYRMWILKGTNIGFDNCHWESTCTRSNWGALDSRVALRIYVGFSVRVGRHWHWYLYIYIYIVCSPKTKPARTSKQKHSEPEFLQSCFAHVVLVPNSRMVWGLCPVQASGWPGAASGNSGFLVPEVLDCSVARFWRFARYCRIASEPGSGSSQCSELYRFWSFPTYWIVWASCFLKAEGSRWTGRFGVGSGRGEDNVLETSTGVGMGWWTHSWNFDTYLRLYANNNCAECFCQKNGAATQWKITIDDNYSESKIPGSSKLILVNH